MANSVISRFQCWNFCYSRTYAKDVFRWGLCWKKKLMWMWSSCSFLCFYAAMECIIRGNLIWFEVKGKDEKKVKNVGWCNENVAIANDWTCSSLVADPNSWNTMLSWGCQWLDDIKFYSSCAKNMSDHMELIPAWV